MDYSTVLAHLHECGLKVDMAITDGLLHRAPTLSKPRSKNGWYICFENALVVGDWMTGVTQTFTSGAKKKMSKYDWQHIKAKVEQEKLKLEQKQDDAALLANNIYACSIVKTDFFKYLDKKQIRPTRDMRFYWNEQPSRYELIIPLVDLSTGEICNIQRITEDGDKRFLAGGRVKGLCFPVGLNEQPSKVYICEGVATATSIHQHLQAPVLAALNAGNLKAIAIQARLLWPDVDLIIAADDDHLAELKTGRNTGLMKAYDASQETLASVSAPPFTDEQKLAGLTDWNDYFCLVNKQGRAA